MNPNVQQPRALPPVTFPAWVRTRSAFAAAAGAGPGLVHLVGPEGSGKSYTLRLFEVSVSGGRVKRRTPGGAMEPGLAVDLVDDVDGATAEQLATAIPPGTVRVLSMRPDALGHVRTGPRVVRVHAMDETDVRTMVATRCGQFAVEPGELAEAAMAELVRLGDGTPRRLDRLLGAALRQALGENAASIEARHVSAAAEALCAQAREGAPLIARDTVAPITAATLQTRIVAAPAFPQPGSPFHPPSMASAAGMTPRRQSPGRDLASGPAALPAPPSWSVPVGIDGETGSADISRNRRQGPWLHRAKARVAAAGLVALGVLAAPQAVRMPALLVEPAAPLPSNARPIAALPVPAWEPASPAPATGPAASAAALPMTPPDSQITRTLGEADPIRPVPADPVLAEVIPAAHANQAAGQAASARRANPAEATRLLQLARAMASIGQTGDAKEFFNASAAMGSMKAKRALEHAAR